MSAVLCDPLMLALPVCTCETLGIVIRPKEESDAEAVEAAERLIAAANEYFADFAATAGECPKCGLTLGGFFGTFTWGICNGEGNCRCGWPCRGLHYPKEGGENIFDSALQFVLPYHPRFVTEPVEVCA